MPQTQEESKKEMIESFYIYLKTEKRLAESTTEHYIRIIKNYFKNGYKISIEDAKKYYLWKLKTTESTYHHKNVCYALKHFFEMKGTSLPIKSPRLEQKRREHISYKDALIFLNNIDDLRDRTMVSLQLTTGLRPQELMNITLGDIDIEKGIVKIKKTKTKIDRVIYLKTHVLLLLERYLRKRGGTHKYLWTCKNKDAPMKLHRYQKLMKKYSEKSGIKVTPYMLRHTFATLFIRNGGDIKALKEIMGHKQIETTERYIHEDEERIREQALKHSPEF